MHNDKKKSLRGNELTFVGMGVLNYFAKNGRHLSITLFTGTSRDTPIVHHDFYNRLKYCEGLVANIVSIQIFYAEVIK